MHPSILLGENKMAKCTVWFGKGFTETTVQSIPYICTEFSLLFYLF